MQSNNCMATNHICNYLSVSCGTPSFAGRVDVELFNSTTVGSQIVYQCQSGFLPDGRMTSVCGGDGRWNPDPATLICECKMHRHDIMQQSFA